MIRELTAQNFRCFRDFEIEPLARVNLIVGESNVGKTALLEAIFILCGPISPDFSFTVNYVRRATDSDESSWKALEWLFHETQTAAPVELTCVDFKQERRRLRICLDEPDERALAPAGTGGNYQSQAKGSAILKKFKELALTYTDHEGREFVSRAVKTPEGIKASSDKVDARPPVWFVHTQGPLSDDHARFFSDLAEAGRENELLSPLKVIDPRFKRIALLYPTDGPMLYADIGLEILVPLPYMGSGATNLLSWLLAIKAAENGTVLIDEFENGLHYTSLVDVWKAVGAAARQSNVQVFATTHSWECVKAAQHAFAESGDDEFHLHRLERRNGEVVAITYDKEQLDSAIEFNFEVR